MAKKYCSILRGSKCTYCGYFAECYDHYLPWSRFKSKYTVPSCHRCNSLLGNKYHETLSQRCDHLYCIYMQRSRYILSLHLKDKLKGMRPGTFLYQSVLNSIEKQNIAKNRLYELNMRAKVFDGIYLATLYCDYKAIDLISSLAGPRL
jgi:hypothetical protein